MAVGYIVMMPGAHHWVPWVHWIQEGGLAADSTHVCAQTAVPYFWRTILVCHGDPNHCAQRLLVQYVPQHAS